jgi:hypothetical protein
LIHALKKFSHGQLQNRVDNLRCNFSQRRQYEGALTHARVRNGKLRRFHDQVILQKDVDVSRAGGIAKTAVASHLFFDLFEKLQQLKRCKASSNLADHIQEIRLIQVSNRTGFKKRRDAFDGSSRTQILNSLKQIGLAVAQIGAQRKIDPMWLFHVLASINTVPELRLSANSI